MVLKSTVTTPVRLCVCERERERGGGGGREREPFIISYVFVDRIEDDPDYDPKKDKGATLRLCGVNISCSSILKREEELNALVSCLPANPAVRKKYDSFSIFFFFLHHTALRMSFSSSLKLMTLHSV